MDNKQKNKETEKRYSNISQKTANYRRLAVGIEFFSVTFLVYCRRQTLRQRYHAPTPSGQSTARSLRYSRGGGTAEISGPVSIEKWQSSSG